MNFRLLKILRVAAALIFISLTAALFLDFREFGTRFMADEVLYLQFVPSLLSFLETAALGAAGFMFVLILTLLFGRLYCSTICPFGTLQDIFSRIAGEKQRRYRFTSPHTAIRYGILGLTVILLLAGSGLLLNILDPFSNFGRILYNLLRPIIMAANNIVVPITEHLGLHGVYRVQWQTIAPISIGAALTMLFVAGSLGARHGRLYCNTICPVGTLLGLVAKFSLVRIRLDSTACRECGRCERVCKAGCIDLTTQAVDMSRCVCCYNCLATCPDNALHLIHRPLPTPRTEKQDSGRRNFLIALAAGGLGLAATETNAALPPGFVQSRPTTIPEKRTSPVSPPGSQSIEHFTSKCTACHLCVSACPSRVLAPSFLDYGLSGTMQPQMDFSAAHCNYDCTVCSTICPSGAILPLSKEAKQRTQIGVAHFIRENCVVYTDKTNCGACSEHCPTKAVHMVPYQNDSGRKLVIPEVNNAICVGCGGCEHACPTRPYKAIWVDGNPRHKVAEKPVIQELKQPDTTEDFPF